jgi:eukaryotic-like serine/threonine-protein kinase
MAAQFIDRDRLGVLTKIGQGGQGTVYQAPNARTQFAESMVYKEYKTASGAATVDYTALAAMPALVEESLTVAQAKRLIALAAWPCALVQHGDTSTGFVMPAIPAVFFTALSTAKGTTTAEIQHLLNHPSVLAARGISIDDAQRYQLLRETATTLTFLHQHGVIVGDISPKNLLYALGPHPGVYFIDCDAMRVGGVSALPQLETPGWAVPAGEELATVASDTYKLGLLALRLLAGDQHATNPQQLPATTPTMVRQLITDTLTNPPQRRLLPQAWSTILASAIETAQHQQKTPAPTPLTAAPAVPVVHSRPSANPSAPPAYPPTPPANAPASAAPSPRPPEWPPHHTPPRAEHQPPRKTNWPLITAGTGILAVGAVAAAIAIPTLTKHPTSLPATITNTSTATAPAAQILSGTYNVQAPGTRLETPTFRSTCPHCEVTATFPQGTLGTVQMSWNGTGWQYTSHDGGCGGIQVVITPTGDPANGIVQTFEQVSTPNVVGPSCESSINGYGTRTGD